MLGHFKQSPLKRLKKTSLTGDALKSRCWYGHCHGRCWLLAMLSLCDALFLLDIGHDHPSSSATEELLAEGAGATMIDLRLGCSIWGCWLLHIGSTSEVTLKHSSCNKIRGVDLAPTVDAGERISVSSTCDRPEGETCSATKMGEVARRWRRGALALARVEACQYFMFAIHIV